MAEQTNIRRRGKAWVVSARVNGTQQWKYENDTWLRNRRKFIGPAAEDSTSGCHSQLVVA